MDRRAKINLKQEFGPYQTPYTNQNGSKPMQQLKLKLLEENIGVNFCDLGVGSGFMDMILKA